MSDYTICNRCMLRAIKRSAENMGCVVTVRPAARTATLQKLDPSCTSVEVFVHPADVEPDSEKHFRAWMWKLTDECAC